MVCYLHFQPHARKRLCLYSLFTDLRASTPGPRLMSKTLPALLGEFDQAVTAGARRKACDLLGEILALTGDRSDVLASYGHLLLELGDADRSEKMAWRSIALDSTHEDTLKLLGMLKVRSTHRSNGLQMLPGTPYARYAMPLDYAPSRRSTPRWGFGQPVHSGLASIFGKRRHEYEGVLAELRTLTPFLSRIGTRYSVETAPEPGWVGPPINAIDLALLYYFVWKHRPATYLEIGSGATTCFARRAVTDHSIPTKIVSIDPEPRSSIDGICDEVIRDGLETLPSLQVFADLEPGDIVFMDGSHRCFMNSDVTVFFLDVLPLLKPGVIVHIHDIVLPFDYPEMFTNWYWNEQYVLAAYLLGMGDRIKILMPSKYVSGTDGLSNCLLPPLLEGVGPREAWLDGGSFWFTHT